MKILRILLAITLLLAPGFGAVAQIPSDAADAVFLELNKTYTLGPDGSCRFEYSHRVRLLTYFAVNSIFGETFVVTNPEYQTLTVEKSETTMADGIKVASPVNAFNEVLPGFVHNAPRYAHLREMVITHTGLERGCEVVLRYRIDTRAGFLPGLWGEELFGQASPVEKMTVTVVVPENTVLAHTLKNSTIQPVVRRAGGTISYVWSMEKMEALVPEANRTAFDETAPKLVFSTCPDWKSAAEPLARNLAALSDLPSDAKQALIGHVSEVDRLSKILAIRQAVADQIANVPMDLAYLGWRPVSANTVFRSNYGNSLDKAVLLKSLLDAEGFPSSLALVPTARLFDNAVSTLEPFDSACLLVEGKDEKPLLLFTDRHQTRPGQIDLAGKTLLVIRPDGPSLWSVPAQSAEENKVRLKADLVLGTDLKITGKAVIETRGAAHPGYDMSSTYKGRKRAQTLLEQWFGKASVDSVSTREIGPSGAVYEADIRDLGSFTKLTAGDLYEFSGLRSFIDAWGIRVGMIRRTTALEIPFPVREEADVSIAIPEGIRVMTLPSPVSADGGSAGCIQTVEKTEKGIRIHRILHLDQKSFSPDIYAEFRKCITESAARDTRTLVVEKK